jgi:PPK2 family polyphosphate:nucleotide phosphotransferase
MARISHRRIERFIEPFRVKPGLRVRLPKDFDPAYGVGRAKAAEAKALLQQGIQLLSDYQARLAAQDTYGLLVFLQAMDAAGKDGTIRHVMSGVNPQGVSVHSFKQPSAEDLDHDFLWRYQRAAPERGTIGIFNRSHYEEVLIVRVHPDILAKEKLPPGPRGGKLWKRRYRSINDWEEHLVENGIHVVKLFLNLSWEEQKRRFLSRIDEPDKNWKFSPTDAHERTYWDDYQRAFAEMLGATSTDHAPWYVIPADDKPFARVAAAAVIADALMRIDPKYPKVTREQRDALQTTRLELLGKGGNGTGSEGGSGKPVDRTAGAAGAPAGAAAGARAAGARNGARAGVDDPSRPGATSR